METLKGQVVRFVNAQLLMHYSESHIPSEIYFISAMHIFANERKLIPMRSNVSMLRLYILAIVAMLVGACTRHHERFPEFAKGFVIDGDSLILPPFEVEVQLSDAARDQFATEYETVVVLAQLYGHVRPGSGVVPTAMGGIFLATPQVEVNAGEVARFDSVRISLRDFNALVNKNFQVLLSLRSGFHSHPMHILSGNVVKDSIGAILDHRHKLTARLTTE